MSDLYVGSDEATELERRAVDAVVGPEDAPVVVEDERLVRGGYARRREMRHLLLPALHALQHETGWISPGGLNYVATQLQVPPAEAYGVATFYDLFRTTDPGHTKPTVHVCVDAPCSVRGSAALMGSLEQGGSQVHASPCLGQCERAPAQFVQGVGTPDFVPADADGGAPLPQAGDRSLVLLARIGVVDPTSLASYQQHGGYEALHAAIAAGSDAVVDMVAASGLSGRGGAAFPTGVKWRAVADEAGPKHVVANADESEPGTFKDRILMEQDPFAVVEAMTIAGLATGAEHGWIYIRGEYPLATQRITAAIDAARTAALLGADVAGSGHAFDIEVRRGAGAYICGEETALFNSIEGFRGEPRNKPPFPTTHGLFGQPTAINNPETLLNVLPVVLDGPERYRERGTEGSPGTKLFCLSGSVAKPGLYEFAFGTTLGEALARAGGVSGGELQAVLMGGAAGSFVGPNQLDLPLTLEDSRAGGTTLGSGVIMAFDATVPMTPVVTRLAEFFRDESCGQCVPCRVGTVRQHEVLTHIGNKPLPADRVALIDDMAVAMADASICGLGHTAANAVQSAIALGLLPTVEGGAQ